MAYGSPDLGKAWRIVPSHPACCSWISAPPHPLIIWQWVIRRYSSLWSDLSEASSLWVRSNCLVKPAMTSNQPLIWFCLQMLFISGSCPQACHLSLYSVKILIIAPHLKSLRKATSGILLWWIAFPALCVLITINYFWISIMETLPLSKQGLFDMANTFLLNLSHGGFQMNYAYLYCFASFIITWHLGHGYLPLSYVWWLIHHVIRVVI